MRFHQLLARCRRCSRERGRASWSAPRKFACTAGSWSRGRPSSGGCWPGSGRLSRWLPSRTGWPGRRRVCYFLSMQLVSPTRWSSTAPWASAGQCRRERRLWRIWHFFRTIVLNSKWWLWWTYGLDGYLSWTMIKETPEACWLVSEALIRWRPARTRSLSALAETTQWAAVSTHFSFKMEPPQLWLQPKNVRFCKEIW